jgi:hypothetical protein
MSVPLSARCAAAVVLLVGGGMAPAAPPGSGEGDEGLTVIAIGDAGENNGVLRGCGTYITNMHTGEHDAGKFDLLFFLGDNFGPTGLNIPVGEVPRKVEEMLEPFRGPMEDLGRGHIHSLAGEHDYYARNAIEGRLLLGLVKIEEAPIGLTDRGNRREAAIDSWTYHYGMPAEAVYPLGSRSEDSVQFIFFDSALPLRTPAGAWRPALDSLRGILARDRGRPHVLWRIFCAHHPFVSAGEHGGYTAWDDESQTVEYVPPCDRDSNAFAWIRNSLDPEDLCAQRYRDWVDSLRHVIRDERVKVQFALSGHDHSLQLLSEPAEEAGDPFPSLQIISGAVSTPAPVRFPSPPAVFTSSMTAPSDRGESLPGFVRITFGKERCTVVFYNGNNGDRIDMGGGAKKFQIGAEGTLLGN